MRQLELKTAVQPVERRMTLDVHRGIKLRAKEVLASDGITGSAVAATFVDRLTEVTQRDLHVHQSRHLVRQQHEQRARRPARSEAGESHEPCPEHSQRSDLVRAVAHRLGSVCDEEERLRVEIESRHSHDRVVENVLVRDEPPAGRVECAI